MRTYRITKVFNGILLFLAFSLIYFSQQKLNQESSLFNFDLGQIIGRIAEHSNTVQVKYPNELTWKFIDNQDVKQVFSNTYVFAHKNSNAKLSLKGNQEIIVKSESLIRLKTQDSIQIKDGDIEIKLEKNQAPLKIQIGNKEIFIEAKKASNLTISKKFTESEIKVSKGEVTVDINLKKIELTQGTSTKINEKNKITQSEISTKLIAPQYSLIQKADEGVLFEFETDEKEPVIVIEGENFKRILKNTTEAFLPPGEFRWGILTGKNSKPLSWKNFKLIRQTSSPSIISPLPNTILSSVNFPFEIKFEWELDQVIFELFDSEQKLISSKEVFDTKAAWEIPKAGKYYWRIRENRKYYLSSPLEPVAFEIIHLEKVPSQDIQINEFLVEQDFQLLKIRLPAHIDLSGENKIIIASDKDFQIIISDQQILENYTKIPIKKAGTYYWKILTPNGEVLPTSQEQINIELEQAPPPMQAPKIKNIIIPSNQKLKNIRSYIQQFLNLFISYAYASEEYNIQIEWDKIENAQSYEIEIIDSQTKKVLYQETLGNNKIQWKLNPLQNIQYRVRYIDIWDRKSPYSEYANIQFEIPKPLETVSIKKPTPAKKRSKKKTKKPNEKITKSIPKKVRSIIVKKPIQKEVSKKSYTYSLTGYHLLHFDDYLEASSTNNVTVKGLGLTGHSFQLIKVLKEKEKSLTINYSSAYGNVFEQQLYAHRSLSLSYQFTFKGYKLSSVGIVDNFTTYEVSNNTSLFKENIYLFSVGVSGELPIYSVNQHFLTGFTTLSYLNLFSLELGVSYQYRLSNSSFINVKLLSQTKNWNENSLQTFHLLSGYGINF